jgi:hypothetical protein
MTTRFIFFLAALLLVVHRVVGGVAIFVMRRWGSVRVIQT